MSEPIKRDHRYMTKVLDRIMNIWYRFPELRLGQLLENGRIYSDTPNSDMFNVQDEALLTGVEHIEGHVVKSSK